jgi:hypothetical protein
MTDRPSTAGIAALRASTLFSQVVHSYPPASAWIGGRRSRHGRAVSSKRAQASE